MGGAAGEQLEIPLVLKEVVVLLGCLLLLGILGGG